MFWRCIAESIDRLVEMLDGLDDAELSYRGLVGPALRHASGIPCPAYERKAFVSGCLKGEKKI
jgi:hypothetical protein